MNYPMKEVRSSFGGTTYEEMTPEEYEEELDFFRFLLERLSNNSTRREQEYASYLRRWFSDEKCDGWDSFEFRHQMHKLPMSFNVYFWG